MNVLLIRAPERSAKTVERLAELGHVAAFLPVTRTNIVPFALPAQTFDGIIFTSAVAPPILASAVNAQSTSEISLGLTCWCVGEATANAAGQAGFSNVRTGPGNAEQLAAAIAGHYRTTPERLYYPSARVVSFDMEAALKHQSVLRQIVYEVELLDLAPGTIADALEKNANGAMLLYSARATAQFLGLVARSDLTPMLASTTIIAISDKVARVVETETGLKPKVAATPDEEAMLALL